VKPGITGMAQVKGYRGKTSSFFDVAHRYKWDMFYVNNCSLKLDLRIIKLTIIATVGAMCAFAGLKERKIAEVNFQLDQPEYLN
jgi:putative colanic acid biosynthesis UDP-glucose lipid carrier transferase